MSNNPYYGPEGHGPYEMIGIGDVQLEEGGVIPDCKLAVAPGFRGGLYSSPADVAAGLKRQAKLPEYQVGTRMALSFAPLRAPCVGPGRGSRTHQGEDVCDADQPRHVLPAERLRG